MTREARRRWEERREGARVQYACARAGRAQEARPVCPRDSLAALLADVRTLCPPRPPRALPRLCARLSPSVAVCRPAPFDAVPDAPSHPTHTRELSL